MSSLLEDPGYEQDLRKELDYKPGAAQTELAKRFGHMVGAQVKTVGQAFQEFNKELGFTVNPLYKNMVSDIVGTTHLIVVNARFVQDPIWSCGILEALDLLLKTYPEPEIRDKIASALFVSCGLDEDEIRSQAKRVEEWASGKTKEQVERSLSGQGDDFVAELANAIKADEYWMYSRYFGLGLLKIMDIIGIEMDKEGVYPIVEDWMQNKLGRSPLTACSDSDLYFKVKDKLEMMETMMKEIEIREKKRMAERLEEKAEAALRAADKEKQLEAEYQAEAAKVRERVKSE